MGLAAIEIVRELEDKVRCPHCASYWVEAPLLGPDDWVISALGLRPSLPPVSLDAVEPERVSCVGCGRDLEIDVRGVLDGMAALPDPDSRALRSLVAFKRAIFDALMRGQAVTTRFGLFFTHRFGARRFTAVDGSVIHVRPAVVPQFLPCERFVDDVAGSPVLPAQIRSCMTSRRDEGFWDLEREELSDVAAGVTIPESKRSLDLDGLYEDVVADLRETRSSVLRGLGAWVVRRVGTPQRSAELVEFSFWRAFTHVLQTRAGAPD